MKKSIHFNEFLTSNGLIIDDIYNAMLNPDLSVVVMKILEILQENNSLPPIIPKECKTENKSTAFRNEGKRAYARSMHQTALTCYNKALLFAPKGSRALKLAYGSRSALLYNLKAYKACVNDINTCLSLGCPPDVVNTLKSRKEDANNSIRLENLSKNSVKTVFSEEYFQLNKPGNPQIPCASMDVGVVIENDVPKIVATNDIKVGTVVAVETAFMSKNDPSTALFSCYHCHKLHLNLKPCEGCCYALFCDETCREVSLREYHSIECQIIDALESLTASTWLRMSLNTLLKMKQMCKSWPKLIAASQNMGLSKIKSSSINEIYDSNSMFSLLSIKEDKHFLYGLMYNTSVNCAFIIYYLEKVSGFYPQLPRERNEAKHAVARMLMFLSLYTTNTLVFPSTTLKTQGKLEYSNMPNFGWFSFLGKLKSACYPNVLVVGLNKKIGLVAQQPIKQGTELTVSFM